MQPVVKAFVIVHARVQARSVVYVTKPDFRWVRKVHPFSSPHR